MFKTLTIAAVLAGSVVIAAPASAAPLSAAAGSATTFAESGKDLVQNVQYRRYGYGYGPRYGYGYRGGYYRGGRGAAVGAGVAAGILGGALAAGALAAPAYPAYPAPAPVYVAPDADAIAYCSRRFRSYDPETGTYIGSGGVVRSCP